MTAPAAPSAVPAGATSQGDGIVLGNGPVVVDAYIDFLCPYCQQFELASATRLSQLVAGGAISLVYHPMSFLDAASTTRYSSRAGSAAGCAADAGKFAEYAHALFVSQPPEGGAGLSDHELVRLGSSVGLADQRFSAGVLGHRYLEWPPYVTEVATARGVTGTPTVLADGKPVPPDGEAIAAAAGDA